MISGSFILELPHVTLSGFRHGRGPGVLYIHDELSSAWTPFLDVLADMFEVTSIELPGFGDSERPEWAETIEDYAFIVADLVDLFVLEGPLALVGAGLGGWLALEAVIRGAPASAHRPHWRPRRRHPRRPSRRLFRPHAGRARPPLLRRPRLRAAGGRRHGNQE